MPYEEIASYESVFNDIKLVLEQGRRHAVAHVNHEMLVTYWNIGRVIVEHEQTNPNRCGVRRSDAQATISRTDGRVR